MADTTLTPEKQAIVDRGHKAVERILKHIPISKVEKLADKIDDPAFRNKLMFKTFLSSL